MRILLCFVLFSQLLLAQVDFNKYFEDKTLRFDYFHTGDKNSDSYSFDEMKSEPYWGGSHKNLLDKFNYGSYKFVVVDEKSGTEIYSRTYSTLFHEWQTTDEAEKTVKSFSETVVFPFPKEKVKVEFYTRDRKSNKLIKKFEYKINPQSYFITPERNLSYPNFKVHYAGDPAKKLDIVILPEGYSAEQMQKFKQDCIKFSNYLLDTNPYKENADKINIWGIEAPSKESGTDIPGDHIWKKTILNSTFYTFDLERYVMTSDNKAVRDLAANAPYDQIYILVNTDKYGGGSIYNHYSVCVSDNKYGEYIFTHEFGHGFAFLGDEYYNSEVAYNDFYPLDVEPLEPNLTTLKNFDEKWKGMVNADTPIPTPNEIKYTGRVGVFEGGGYMNKGIYRPSLDCTMKSISVNNFCRVCKDAIIKMLNFYSE